VGVCGGVREGVCDGRVALKPDGGKMVSVILVTPASRTF